VCRKRESLCRHLNEGISTAYGEKQIDVKMMLSQKQHRDPHHIIKTFEAPEEALLSLGFEDGGRSLSSKA
jgi:hypothetical protein